MSPKFVAVTPAHNEVGHVPGLFSSMAAQHAKPDVWVIANDGSTDGTGERARELASGMSNVHVIDVDRSSGRALSAKAGAVAAAYAEALRHCPDADFVVSLDADIEIPESAFVFLLSRFAENPNLGIGGGIYMHPVDGELVAGRLAPNHVPGPLQMFRREVFDAIGGYRALSDGGLDTVANAHARMLGWETTAFEELQFFHNRRMGTGGDRQPLAADFHGGRRDYSLGMAFPYAVVKCVRRLLDPPIIAGSIARFVGYTSAAVGRRRSDVPEDVAAFIRREQMDRMVPRVLRR